MLARRFLVIAALASATASYAAPSQVHLGWQGPTDTTMTVTWRSTEAAGQITYGTSTAYGRTVAASSTAYGGSYLHEAQLTGLTPGTTYHYRAGDGASLTPDRTFTTAPARSASATFRFAGYGDSRTDDAARARVRAAVQASQPAFSVDSGDLVEDGTNQSLWDQWFTTMEPLIATTPFVAAIGNHEANSPLFYQQLALPNRGAPNTETYASWDYGNVHFVSLDTEIAYGAGSDQAKWLEADLAQASADPRVRWIVAVFHSPPYSSGSHGSDTGVRSAWAPLFEKYGVALVLNGHDHDYERTFPMVNGVAQPAGGKGVVYVVTGGAGAPLYGVGSSSFTAFSRTTYNFVQLDVTPTTLTATAIDDGGKAFDTFTLHNDTAVPQDGTAGAPGTPGATGTPPTDGSGGGAPAAGDSLAVKAGCAVGGAGSLASLLGLLLAPALAKRRRR